ncbi:MAG: hypothetical protein ACYTFG_16405 [Planctomycetota bacterium]|jgi:hypothetical protein
MNDRSDKAENVVHVVAGTFRAVQIVVFGVFVALVSALPFILDTLDQSDDPLPYTACCLTNMLCHGAIYFLYSLFGPGHTAWLGYAYWPLCYVIFIYLSFSRFGSIMFVKTSFWFAAVGLNLILLGLAVMIGIPGH